MKTGRAAPLAVGPAAGAIIRCYPGTTILY